jgi:hypothetical protein
MTQPSLKSRLQGEPSTLAKIVMEVEPLNEKEKLVLLKQVRMRKALFLTEKLKDSVKSNKISLSEIVEEQKQSRLQKQFNFYFRSQPVFLS